MFQTFFFFSELSIDTYFRQLVRKLSNMFPDLDILHLIELREMLSSGNLCSWPNISISLERILSGETSNVIDFRDQTIWRVESNLINYSWYFNKSSIMKSENGKFLILLSLFKCKKKLIEPSTKSAKEIYIMQWIFSTALAVLFTLVDSGIDRWWWWWSPDIALTVSNC